MKITRGGVAVIAPPEEQTPVEFVGNIAPLTHTLWESMLDMQQERAAADGAWERVVALRERLEANPDSPKAMKIINRIDLLSFAVREHQWRFLVLEEDADLRWRRMSPAQREAQQIPDMFGCNAEDEGMIGAWFRRIGEQKPRRFPLDPIMFKFIRPEHAAVYKGRFSWLKDDHIPDSALRKRRG